MTPAELYAMEPESISHDLGYLSGRYFNHVPEITVDWYSTHLLKCCKKLVAIKTDKVEFRFLKNHCFDDRIANFFRVWILATVWFENKPVMIIQNAGIDGGDHSKRFITDGYTFDSMCAYLRQCLYQDEPHIENDFVDSTTDIKNLTKFYHNELGGHFEHY